MLSRNFKIRKKAFCLVSVTLISSFLIGLGFLVLQYRQLKLAHNRLYLEVQKKEKKLAEKEHEIDLLVQDKAKTVKYFNQPYKFEEFGIYSPYFLDKEVSATVFSYKLNTITRKALEIPLDGTESDLITVEVWELTDTSQTPTRITLGYSDEDLRIIDNWQTPVSLLEIKERWQGEFENKNSITFHRAFDFYQPAFSMIYRLEFIQENSPSGPPVFVRLSISSDMIDSKRALSEKAPEELVDRGKLKRLEEIADTIDIRL